ncbi:hypothetical protein KGO95_03255 [Patescibacteria group bacterium]|nr:hypothetical protein [Patescibacteria group bacterium]
MAFEIERRFLVRQGFADNPAFAKATVKICTAKQTYLKKKPRIGNARIRSVFDWKTGETAFFYTEKELTRDPRVRVEREREISKKEYTRLASRKDPSRDVIEKIRFYVRYKKQEFELDVFRLPRRIEGLAILELEMKNKNQKIALPPFLPIMAEITGSLSNSELAKRPR